MSDRHKFRGFNLRIPPERLEWIKARAKANHRSITAEINYIFDRLQQHEQKLTASSGDENMDVR